MVKLKIAKWVGFSGGCLIFLVGVRHFPLAYEMLNYKDFQQLSARASDLFLLLWFCVGLLLINLGASAIYFSRKLKQKDPAACFFFLCTGVVLLIRTGFELIFPVAIPATNPFVMIQLVTMTVLFLIPGLLAISHTPSQATQKGL